MCGLVGAVAQRDVVPILMEGLRRLEYRGYDSAGMAVMASSGEFTSLRALGKVSELEARLDRTPLSGLLGIAHTRWATHGEPSERNAHPHFAGDTVGVVHNGIIENHETLRATLAEQGAEFRSDTDTEVIAHQIHRYLDAGDSLFEAVRQTVRDLHGAYAIAVVSPREPERLVVARRGSPLLIGVGIGEHFVASDVAALLPVTRRFIFLEEGDVAEVTRDAVRISDASGDTVQRPVQESALSSDAVNKGAYRHFMLKEIFEQPTAIHETWQGRLSDDQVLEASLGPGAGALLDQVRGVHIVACGTSSYAGMVARYWIESLAKIPCTVELASEYRYRQPVVPPGTLFLTLSQSGETADTLAALRFANTRDYVGTLAICNVPESSLVRESSLTLLTRAGPEIGVASTKAFTTQLVALLMVTTLMGRRHGLAPETERDIVRKLRALSGAVEQVLLMDEAIQALAEHFVDHDHALFLGRGPMYPIAMEGALKLKEIAYIHAEAYAAGELKHGPLALVDEHMPVITVAPNNELLEKLKSNLQEVRARGGELFVFADGAAGISDGPGVRVLEVPHTHDLIAPVVYTLPLQLLAYHVAVLKGTDVDQPRNLAKSVTVE